MSEMQRLTDSGQLEELWQLSHERPVLIFKHSLACGTSYAAASHVQKLLRDRPAGEEYELRLIEIQKARAVSDEVARKSGIRHESPQVLLIKDGEVIWHGSHSDVHRAALDSALQSAL